MGVALVRARKSGRPPPGQSEPALHSGPGPRPFLPAPFRISPNSQHPGARARISGLPRRVRPAGRTPSPPQPRPQGTRDKAEAPPEPHTKRSDPHPALQPLHGSRPRPPASSRGSLPQGRPLPLAASLSLPPAGRRRLVPRVPHPPAQSEPPGHTLSTNRPGRAQKRQTAARDLPAGLRIGWERRHIRAPTRSSCNLRLSELHQGGDWLLFGRLGWDQKWRLQQLIFQGSGPVLGGGGGRASLGVGVPPWPPCIRAGPQHPAPALATPPSPLQHLQPAPGGAGRGRERHDGDFPRTSQPRPPGLLRKGSSRTQASAARR
ncbi:proline-rich protein 2-like [Cervus elaphus]|uniref:proline-rich protein 2-like n=1 Tax=Cervus elaphus TaxID=9860 RepID=UPI001CC28AB3|nr:proline-rich protein 2-like [Cervus elaphus]